MSEYRKPPPVTSDDRKTAKSVLVLLDLDRDSGIEVLEKLSAAARHYGKGA